MHFTRNEGGAGSNPVIRTKQKPGIPCFFRVVNVLHLEVKELSYQPIIISPPSNESEQ